MLRSGSFHPARVHILQARVVYLQIRPFAKETGVALSNHRSRKKKRGTLIVMEL